MGETIYFNSDRDGHFNLYAYGVSNGKTTQITHSKQWDVRWPSSDHDGRIVYEMDGELQILDARSGKATQISINVPDDGLARRPSRVSAANNIESYDLSPKGERALFSARGDIFTAPIEKGPTRNLTHSSGAHDKWPSWSPDGSQIAFISDMSGEEELYLIAQDGSKLPQQITNVEFNYATNRDSYIYAMALRKDVKHPFPPESDEVAVTKPKEEGAPAAEPKKEGESEKQDTKPAAAPAKTLTIDFDGINNRVTRAPIGADNYGGLAAKPGHLLYFVGPAFYYGRAGDRPAQLRIFSFKDRKESTIADDINGYAMSTDGSKVMVRQQGANFSLFDATP